MRVVHRATLRYMSANPLSLRLQAATLERLGDRAEHAGIPPRTLAQRYVEEGLRADAHPLVRFVDGPAGRRARLIGTGVDVWEAIATVRDNDNDLDAAADYLGVSAGVVQAAAAYYGAFADEIDGLIERNARAAADAHESWRAAQIALGG